MKTFKTLLVDGDLLLWRICSAAEQEVIWDGVFSTRHSSFNDIKHLLDGQIAKYKDRAENPDARVVVCLSGTENYRKKLFEDYKGNRPSLKPLAFKMATEFIVDNFETVLVDSIEADDLMGILATNGKCKSPLIVTDDKDLLQIPGYVLRPRTLEIITTTKEAGDYLHMIQTLTGDRVDNYPGCPGIGAAKAQKLLDKSEDHWATVVEIFESKGFSEEYALTQARLAKILTAEWFNPKTKEPILWQPPSARTATPKPPAPATASKKRGSVTRTTPDRLPSKERRKSASTATRL